MEYTPTSVIFLNIPSISRLQWHPFSISSCHRQGDTALSVVVKCHGPWTSSLYSKLGNSPEDTEANPSEGLPVAVNGPYGPSECPYERYEALILVAGGSGITPFLSMLQDLSARSSNQMHHPAKIRLIYCVRKSTELSMLAQLSSLLLGHGNLKDLKVHIFVTQEARSSGTLQELLHDACSLNKTTETHSGNCFITAEGGLLWKSGVTLSSYLLFLASMVCLNHVFKPKVKGSVIDKVPSWVDDLITIASFTIAISCCAMSTVIWSRIKAARSNQHEPQKPVEGSQQQELEAQDAALACDIRFGRRPNLEKLLSSLSGEIEEAEIGVFVCGPEAMKVATASFCKKQSFSFHSLNFSL